MTVAEKDLWSRIEAFELDDANADLSFSGRLARENGWNLEYALRVIHEYKKFMYLLCVSPHPLTPSDQVDQVWHLHLIYTQSYWVEFCGSTLQKQIHHGPTKGGTSEHEKFEVLYEKTLAHYQTVFSMQAPKDIWPESKARFSEVAFARVNIERNWIIPKPSFLRS